MQIIATIAIVSLSVMPVFAQTRINGGRTVSGAWDASGAAATLPAKTGASLPAICRQGELFFNTSATAGQNLYVCGAPNTWSQIAGGGGGAPTAGGPIASIPACGAATAGEIFLPSDSPYSLWCNGTAWQYRLGSVGATPADNSGFSWVNQGAATAAVSGGITPVSGDILLTAPAAAGFAPRMRVVSNPNGLNFTATAAVSLFSTQVGGSGAGTVGIVARNTVGPGSFVNDYCTFQYSMFFAYGSGGFTITCYDANNNAYAGGPSSGYAYVAPGFPTWIRLKSDGTNFLGQFSTDYGQNWFTAATVPVTMLSSTVNQIGWFVSSDQSSNAIAAALLSWNVTTP